MTTFTRLTRLGETANLTVLSELFEDAPPFLPDLAAVVAGLVTAQIVLR